MILWGVCCYHHLFVSDFINLGLFPPHFIQSSQGVFNLVYFFKEAALCFIDSLYGFFGFSFLVFISLISALIIIISLLLIVRQ
jgi:hypothetical protein